MIYTISQIRVRCDDCGKDIPLDGFTAKIDAMYALRSQGWACNVSRHTYATCPECRKKRVGGTFMAEASA